MGLEKIKLGKLPKAELYLLNLALKNPKSLKTVMDSEILEQFSHAKLSETFLWIHQKYLQNPSEFDKLTASLVDRIEPAQMLNLQFHPELQNIGSEEEQKLVEDCIKRVKQEALRRKARELVSTLSTESAEDKERRLQEIRDLQSSKLEF